MTDNHYKELLSKRYVCTIANKCGYTINEPENDYGEDLTINEVRTYTKTSGETGHAPTGKNICVQLKATIWDPDFNTSGVVKYDLDADTYNMLVDRSKNNRPLLLVLFFLPAEKENWVEQNDEELKIRKLAFYYLPEGSATLTTNLSTKRILIPVGDKISEYTLKNLMNEMN